MVEVDCIFAHLDQQTKGNIHPEVKISFHKNI